MWWLLAPVGFLVVAVLIDWWLRRKSRELDDALCKDIDDWFV